MKSIKPEISSLKNGRYQVKTVLGTGGFGVTYLCMDIYKNRLCAVKEYLPDSIAVRDRSTQDIQPDPERKEEYLHGKKRFCEEAQLLLKMQKLPYISEILDLFEENNTAYYVMEYLDGKNAKQLLREYGGKLPFQMALRIAERSAIVLENVHRSAGIFHRDISPENIMVMSDESVRIIDFGSAKHLERSMAEQFSVILKPGFAPPEQYSSTLRQGSFTDVYSLASTFYYLASGKRVPSAPSRLAGETYRPLCELVPECTKTVSEAVDHALILDQNKRTQTMTEFIRELRGKRAAGKRPLERKPSKRRPAQREPLEREPSEREPLERRSSERRPSERETAERVPSERKPAGKGTGRQLYRQLAETVKDELPAVWFLVESGTCAGKLFSVRSDEWMCVGRNPQYSDITISGHDEISGSHLYLRYDTKSACFYIMDQSFNGTYYKGSRLKKGRAYMAPAGTRLLIGSRKCTVILGESKYAGKYAGEYSNH